MLRLAWRDAFEFDGVAVGGTVDGDSQSNLCVSVVGPWPRSLKLWPWLSDWEVVMGGRCITSNQLFCEICFDPYIYVQYSSEFYFAWVELCEWISLVSIIVVKNGKSTSVFVDYFWSEEHDFHFHKYILRYCSEYLRNSTLDWIICIPLLLYCSEMAALDLSSVLRAHFFFSALKFTNTLLYYCVLFRRQSNSRDPQVFEFHVS